MTSESKYCYPGTDVLMNKKNIRTKEELHKFERGVTTYKLALLNKGEMPFKRDFDANHYFNLHKYLFEDVYDFAGEVRGEAIHKSRAPYADGKTPFCYPDFIYPYLTSTLDEMKYNIRKITDYNSLVAHVTHYYMELNMVHPFREGNGRTLREFMREYVLMLDEKLGFNYNVDYSVLDDEDRSNLMKGIVLDDESLVETMFSKIIVEKEKEKER